jgi:hypothetical protein
VTLAIPQSLDDITAEWLTGALSLYTGTTVRIEAVHVEPIAQGAGFLGQLGRLHITYPHEPTSSPATLIAKLPTGDGGLKEIGMLLGVWERESRFYKDVAPRIRVSVPRCYFNGCDAEGGRFTLLLEDLAAATAGDQMLGASLDQAEVAMTSIAELHAPWWDSP